MNTPNLGTTPDRILDAAERLFAEAGVLGTSLRAITAAADANLASVHYHFGSKEGLVEAVLARRLEPLTRERLETLERLEKGVDGAAPPLESILDAFLGPAIRSGVDPTLRPFLRLMGRMFAEAAAHDFALVHHHFGTTAQRFTAALQRALPYLSPQDIAWRFHFMVGAMVHVIVHPERLGRMTGGLCEPGDVEATLAHLIAFVVAGLRAPSARGAERTTSAGEMP